MSSQLLATDAGRHYNSAAAAADLTVRRVAKLTNSYCRCPVCYPGDRDTR